MHEITTDEAGHAHGTDGTHTLSLLDPAGRMFRRRAIKAVGTEAAREENWLVAELNGVRVYQRGAAVIVTTQDMWP
jgi:hypothetical protein